MMTRAGTNAVRGTVNYQYWTNKLNALNRAAETTFDDRAASEFFEKGRSHNMALHARRAASTSRSSSTAATSCSSSPTTPTSTTPSPARTRATSTVPANAKHLQGDFSDLLRLPNPAQYQIYDPLTVRPDPANPNRFIRDPFPNNIIPANRIVNPLYNLYRQMVPHAESELRRERRRRRPATTTGAASRTSR